MLFGALLLGFFHAFFHFSYDSYGGIGRGICWPHFQNCESLKTFWAYPEGYSLMAVYALSYGLILLAGVFAYQNRWNRAHACVLVLFFWKFFVGFFLSHDGSPPFEYYHLALCALFLFASNKIYFAQRLLVALYFSAASIKFHDAWITGSFFTSLELGMPFIPDSLAPLFSNFVLLQETLLCWLLVSENRKIQKAVVALFIFFHLYSILLIGYNFPTYSLVPFIILFVFAEPARFPQSLRSMRFGVFILALIYILHFAPYVIARGQPYSQEDYRYGLGMFINNNQCDSRALIYQKSGEAKEHSSHTRMGISRCSVFSRWFELQKRCQDPNVDHITWTFDYSKNGHPFYRFVDAQDACKLTYNAWSPNSWIRLPDENSTPTGYPQKNVIWEEHTDESKPLIYAKPQFEQPHEVLRSYLSQLILLWTALWFATGAYQLFRFIGKLRT